MVPTVDKVGRYEIVGELGRGAMGLVYRAVDPNIGRTVALKTMRLDVPGMEHDEMLRRFRYEAKAAGAMNHPNIVTIYDADEVDGLFYIAMESWKARRCSHLWPRSAFFLAIRLWKLQNKSPLVWITHVSVMSSIATSSRPTS